MIFVGYSSKDRYTITEPLLFHLKHFGLDVWYDFHDMFLGDNRYQTNFIDGIGASTYIICIISPHLFESVCAIEEIEFARNMIENKKAVFFPIFYNFNPEDLPESLCWIRNIIYNEIQGNSGSRYVAYQIVEKVLQDELQRFSYGCLYAIIEANSFEDKYIVQLLKSWADVDERSYGVRIGILYSLYCYLPNVSTNYIKPITYIFLMLQMNEPVDHLIYSIFEKSMTIYLSHVIQKPN